MINKIDSSIKFPIRNKIVIVYSSINGISNDCFRYEAGYWDGENWKDISITEAGKPSQYPGTIKNVFGWSEIQPEKELTE